MSVVLKFGGTSVRHADAIARLGEIVRRERRPAVVVVSALAGVTDQLVELSAHARAGRHDPAPIESMRARHLELTGRLVSSDLCPGVERAIHDECDELRSLIHAVATLRELTPRSSDAVLSRGEAMSSRVVSAALETFGLPARWVDASQVLVTTEAHGKAQPLLEPTAARVAATVRPLLDDGMIVVMGGFVGVTEQGVTTTLGRGGSDYSAAVIGAALESEEIQIWTDVDGMLTADPRIVPHARLVTALSFSEASELAYFGAKVLHPATIQPAVTRNIPVRILNSQHPERTGTQITAHPTPRDAPVAALASKRGLTVIEIASARMLMAHGFLRRLFEVFDRFETAVDVITTSEVNVSVTIDDASRLDTLVRELATFADVSTVAEMAILCVVGERLHDDAGLFRRVVNALGDAPCRMVSQSSSRRNLTFVLREADLAETMTRLHDDLFPRPVEAGLRSTPVGN